jgi:drug/metabolite transporter (DMT)-like permease
MIQIPLLGALALGSGTVLEKIILKKRKLNIKLYQTMSFLAITVLMIPLLFFFWKMDSQAFGLKNILIFAGVIIISVLANILALYSLKWEKVTNLEPAKLFEPLFVISLAMLLSLFVKGIYETNSKFILPALIAGLAIIFPHIKKEHLKFNKYFIAALFGSFFFALELVLSKLILNLYSPITFYFLRCLFVFLISFALFMPKFSSLNKKSSFIIFITAGVWIVYRIAVYFGYLNYGIIFTTLITMLAPVVVYLFASLFLKEKLNWKNVLSSAVIVACIVYSLLA